MAAQWETEILLKQVLRHGFGLTSNDWAFVGELMSRLERFQVKSYFWACHDYAYNLFSEAEHSRLKKMTEQCCHPDAKVHAYREVMMQAFAYGLGNEEHLVEQINMNPKKLDKVQVENRKDIAENCRQQMATKLSTDTSAEIIADAFVECTRQSKVAENFKYAGYNIEREPGQNTAVHLVIGGYSIRIAGQFYLAGVPEPDNGF